MSYLPARPVLVLVHLARCLGYCCDRSFLSRGRVIDAQPPSRLQPRSLLSPSSPTSSSTPCLLKSFFQQQHLRHSSDSQISHSYQPCDRRTSLCTRANTVLGSRVVPIFGGPDLSFPKTLRNFPPKTTSTCTLCTIDSRTSNGHCCLCSPGLHRHSLRNTSVVQHLDDPVPEIVGPTTGHCRPLKDLQAFDSC